MRSGDKVLLIFSLGLGILQGWILWELNGALIHLLEQAHQNTLALGWIFSPTIALPFTMRRLGDMDKKPPVDENPPHTDTRPPSSP